ncbi:hypothetical protein [Halococcus thailandensis]|uniref:hypothetical protein n=1 Tax=Halococcus thailandensis TaxID=335952 RepID=UPI00137570B3|nr:hypothetical protein [Halococcus thailandensis]
MDRYPLLEDLLTSDESTKHRVGLEAAEHVLSISGHRGSGIPQRQGAKPTPDLWYPENNEERIEYFKSVWDLVYNNIDRYNEEHFEKTIGVLTGNSRRLASNSRLSRTIQSTFSGLIAHRDVDAGDILTATSRIVHYDSGSFSEDLQKSWKEFEHEIIDQDIHTKLKRYISGYNTVDYSEEREEATKRQIANLAGDVVTDPQLLKDEIGWILEENGKPSRIFGSELGQQDATGRMIDVFIEGLRTARPDAACTVFGSYLEEVVDSCENPPEDLFLRLRKDPHLANYFPFLARKSDPTDRAAIMIYNSAKQDEISVDLLIEIRYIARMGNLSEQSFARIGSYLLDAGTAKAAGIFVNIACDYYRTDSSSIADSDLILEALTHPDYTNQNSKFNIFERWFEWGELANIAILQNHPDRLRIAEFISNCLEQNQAGGELSQYFDRVLRPLFEEQPMKTWDLVAGVLDSTPHRTQLEYWLSGREVNSDGPAILLVPESELWKWVDKDPDKRASILVRCLPDITHADWWGLTQKLLIRHGDKPRVFEELRALPMGRMGSEEQFHIWRGKLQELKRNATDPIVKRWLSQEIQAVDRLTP